MWACCALRHGPCWTLQAALTKTARAYWPRAPPCQGLCWLCISRCGNKETRGGKISPGPLPSSCSIGMGWRRDCQTCRSLLLGLVCWCRTMYMARAQRRNQPVPQSGRHSPFSTHHQRIGLGSMQRCRWEGAAACSACAASAVGVKPRRQLLKWGSGAPGASTGATLPDIIYPWARRCLQGAHVGAAVIALHFLGEGCATSHGPWRSGLGTAHATLSCMTAWRTSVRRSE